MKGRINHLREKMSKKKESKKQVSKKEESKKKGGKKEESKKKRVKKEEGKKKINKSEIIADYLYKKLFYRAAMEKTINTFIAEVEGDWEEIYFAYFLSDDRKKSSLLAAVQMKGQEKLVNYSLPEPWNNATVGAHACMDAFAMEAYKLGEDWYMGLFRVSSAGLLKMYFAKMVSDNMDISYTFAPEVWVPGFRNPNMCWMEELIHLDKNAGL